MPRTTRRALLALGAAGLAAPALGQGNYPSRTLTIIVPFAAGGPTDTVTRLTAEAMGRDLGQTVVVENVGGAGGTLGAGASRRRGRTATRCCCTTSAWRRRPPSTAACPTTR
jgi:tripartite-type tricarboxylate transporter receptor subunit TctC